MKGKFYISKLIVLWKPGMVEGNPVYVVYMSFQKYLLKIRCGHDWSNLMPNAKWKEENWQCNTMGTSVQKYRGKYHYKLVGGE